ncbi:MULTISPECIES: hypothetical protein [Streptomyces]|uniref:LPXTG-motif cell wall anchor domain-containing protein n=1 Tax=Streptomyces lonegramiae TaxID=3075524 RepID=A0ABU2XTB9_9ACTN|nr:hypothetical protein [Streptomyces sp. DSM 41529]MDT0548775.1 hypothetical protein [Streptomyces sp. DSM 41529]
MQLSARRPLMTAAAAGSLLCALWFVPSANATVEREGQAPAAQTRAAQPASGENLADTGSVDVTPYLIGGTAFLGLGVAMVTASVRRTRPEAY